MVPTQRRNVWTRCSVTTTIVSDLAISRISQFCQFRKPPKRSSFRGGEVARVDHIALRGGSAVHRWRTEVRFRTCSVHPTVCPKCARVRPRRKLTSSNNFETWRRKNGDDKGGHLLREYEDRVKEAHAVTYGSEHKAWWKCETCKKRWQAPVT